MKILKYILLLVLILAVGLAIYAAMQPDAFEVKRTRVLNAPVEVVYNNVSDYKNWEAWLPWKEQDPAMTLSYGDQTQGQGASYSWSGSDGDGSMKMVEAKPNKAIVNEMTFDGMGSSQGLWSFKPVENGTEVTWGMKTEKSAFIMKLISALNGGYDNMMGPMFERGLEKLDSIVQIQAKDYTPASSWSMGNVTKKPMEAQTFIGYPHLSNTEEAMQLFQTSMPKAGMYAANKGLQPDEYMPSAIYNNWDMETGEVDFVIGLFLKKDLAPAEGMKKISLPKGEVIMVSKFGDYGVGDEEAHMAIAKFMKENNLSAAGPVYEKYVNDPTEVPASEIQTDIYYPVK
ncbi:GyrI-like domain-containing protein [Maribacter sp.]|nr:GyrI-like domain-containing protein [Maribacter sp.]